MGDLSAEPSMEEILSSIKRIIAEEGDATPARQRRQQRAAAAAPPPPVADEQADADEVLELKDAVPQKPAAQVSAPEPEPVPQVQPAAEATPAAQPQSEEAPVSEPILSRQAAESTRGSLETLSRLLVKPEPESDGTLEGLVREMLRPILREWLDANLPGMVQSMVSREIAKITGSSGLV